MQKSDWERIENDCEKKQNKTITKRLKVRFKLSIKYLDAVYQPYQGCHDVRPGMRGSHCIQGALGQCKGIPMRNRRIRSNRVSKHKGYSKGVF